MTRVRLLSSALAVAILVMAPPGAAQTPLEPVDPLNTRDARRVERMEQVVRELRAIVFQMRDSGKPVVVQPADTDARMGELVTRISDLEETLRRLNGTLETLTRELTLAGRETTDMKGRMEVLDKRLADAEAKLVAPVAAVEPPAAAPPAAADAGAAFTRAREMMLAGDYDGAEAAFAAYVEAYPDGPRSAEARYWWGKTLTVRNAHPEAAAAYIGAIRGWPQTGWAPDATVELARSLVAMKQPTDACQTLAEFRRRYPKAPANVAARATTARTQAKCA